MSRVATAAAVALMIVFAPIAGAQVKAGGILTYESDKLLTLVSVDPISQTAVLRGSDGVSLALELPTEAQKMQHAKPGALFRLHSVESLGFEIERGGIAGTFEDRTAALAPPGATPSIELVTVKRFAFNVQAVDKTRHRITLRDAQNNVSTLTYVGLLQGIGEIAIGDTFNLLHIEAVTLEMMPDQIQTSR